MSGEPGEAPDGPRTLIVVAKEPVPGRVKTRLCPPCSLTEAAALAEAALIDTLDAVVRSAVDRRVLVLDGQPGPWVPPGVEVIAQRGRSFTARLDHAWSDALGGRRGPTVQIGMDTPQVTDVVLDAAFDALADATAVIGPALDGGWWALGLWAHLPGAFATVPMSSPETGRRQEQRLAALLGTTARRLPVLRDVDDFADALAVAGDLPGTRFAERVQSLAPTAGSRR